MATYVALLFTGPAQASISPEAGQFYSQQYGPKVYSAAPQDWAIVQDDRGIMLFGNTDGLLSFDGARWHTVFQNTAVLSLSKDTRGTVFVGGQNELGYLRTANDGHVQYVSLVNQIPKQYRNFGEVWNVFCNASGTWFSSHRFLFLWSSHGIKVFTPPPTSAFTAAFMAHAVPYVRVRGIGLYHIIEDRLELMPGGEVFRQPGLLWGAFYFAGSLFVATDNGLYRYNGRRFTELQTDAKKILQEGQITSCLPLRNGELAIGTARRGLVLLNESLNLDRTFDKSDGLESSFIRGMYEDRQHGLWLALDRGIARIDVESPLTFFGDHEGLQEVVWDTRRQDNTLYAATFVGLYRLTEAKHGAKAYFQPVTGIRKQVLTLLSTPHGLLAGGWGGIYQISADQAKNVLALGEIYDLSGSIRDPELVFAAGREKLSVLRHISTGWIEENSVPAEGNEFRSVIEDADGSVWIGTRSDILRVNWTRHPAVIEHFAKDRGVPEGWKNAYRVKGKISFATQKGLRTFDSRTQRFIPDLRFGKRFADGSAPVDIVREGKDGSVWISGSGYLGVLRPRADQSYDWHEDIFARTGMKTFYSLYMDENGVIWASGTEGGVVRYENRSSLPNEFGFGVLLRRVEALSGKETVYEGASPSGSLPRFPHRENALRFEFAAPTFEEPSLTCYQVRLEKLDQDWSNWSSETSKEYTNLWEGKYTLRVRAKDLYGHIGEEMVFRFQVLSPWYRSWWAFLLYGLAAVATISLLVKWRLMQLAARNRQLECIISERTLEIRQQRDEIQAQEHKTEALLLNILPAQVADELRTSGAVTPQSFDNITVCFTDFVGFTLSSEKLSADKLVTILHEYFTAFDEIIGRYGLEKLKTIGDAYMFVGGLPEQKRSHAVNTVMAALEIVQTVERLAELHPDIDWKIRVGIHSGPVVAGIVGVKKFAFDIWGETVNFASRFESSGKPNHVNVSSRTYDLVREFIECEARGMVAIKEGRKLEMYFARGIRKELLENNENSSSKFHELYWKRFGEAPPHFKLGSVASEYESSTPI